MNSRLCNRYLTDSLHWETCMRLRNNIISSFHSVIRIHDISVIFYERVLII